jgi:hypothetical protein
MVLARAGTCIAASRLRAGRCVLVLAAAASLAGCGGGFVIGDIDGFDRFGCDDEIAHVISQRGSPDTVDRRIEGGLHVHTFWYFGSGVGITFLWGGDLPCERRDVVLQAVPR